MEWFAVHPQGRYGHAVTSEMSLLTITLSLLTIPNDGANPMERVSDPLFVFFGKQLKRLRESKGWSQEAFGKRIGYSGEMVSKVEKSNNPPSREFAASCDREFPGMGGMFTALVEAAENSTSAYPAWFQTWLDAEKRASVLRSWQPLVVPGPLQTAEYARVLFEAWCAVDGNRDVDRDVAARLARQDIFDRPAPPSFGVVLDESVLYRCVGSPAVMYAQLVHLVEMSERPRVSVQVLPTEVGAHVGLGGAFVTVSFAGDTPGMVYFETADEGEVSKLPARLARMTVTYDALRDDALNARASRDLMRKVAEDTWKA
jgi:DNA-binding XRE family transcriptional regulator